MTKVAGDPDHPLSRGYVCPKGRRSARLPDDPARLDRPLMRDMQGRLVPVSWDEALDDLGGRLAAVIGGHGPYAVGNYSGTTLDSGGRHAAAKLMRAIGSPSRYTSATVDSIAKVLVGKLMAGREGLVPAVDFDRTELLLIVGENLVVSHGGFSYFPDPVRYLRTVARRGEVWVLDPRRTETAHHATRHLTPRSGTDFAVLGHLIRELLRDGADRAYLDSHARGVDELARAVEALDRTRTAELSGLAETELLDLLASVRRSGRLAVITGTGVTMAATGNVTEWMAYALQVVTGSFEREGGRWFNHSAAVAPGASAPAPAGPPGFGPGPRTHPDIGRLADQYPCAVMAPEMEAGHLRALLVTGGNPMVAFPEPDRLARALAGLDVLAVWDIVPSATADLATHVLPCPDPLERADLITPVHLSLVYAQYTEAVVPARAGRRPMWWSIASLAARMGLSILPGGAEPDDYGDHDLFRSIVDGTAVDWDGLLAAGGRPVPYPRHPTWVRDTVLPDGRWDVAPELLMPRMEHALSRPAHRLVLGNRRQVQHTNSTLAWTQPEPCVYINPDDAAAVAVEEGDLVEVASPYGAVQVRARIEAARAAGSVAVPHGFSQPNVGRLTSIDVDVDPLTGMPTLVGVPVTLRLLRRRSSSVS